MTDTTLLYDSFSVNYDRFVNWQNRLAYEMPFIDRFLKSIHARRVLDVACGTGMHTVALTQRGYDAEGVDVSSGMIHQARANALAAGVDTAFSVAGFENLVSVEATYDAILCLGNSLPHILTKSDLEAALYDFGAILRPGGSIMIQNRNFDVILSNRDRWMDPQTFCDNDREWVFIRFYDFMPDGGLAFNVMTLYKDGEHVSWDQNVQSSQLWPWRYHELVNALENCGFAEIRAFGDMAGNPFDPETSGNLILTAVQP
jgi:2-polyprenyl-3-methyl-5-hydroxy-6-metoxy-1,4-benzoquinol methylase